MASREAPSRHRLQIAQHAVRAKVRVLHNTVILETVRQRQSELARAETELKRVTSGNKALACKVQRLGADVVICALYQYALHRCALLIRFARLNRRLGRHGSRGLLVLGSYLALSWAPLW